MSRLFVGPEREWYAWVIARANVLRKFKTKIVFPMRVHRISFWCKIIGILSSSFSFLFFREKLILLSSSLNSKARLRLLSFAFRVLSRHTFHFASRVSCHFQCYFDEKASNLDSLRHIREHTVCASSSSWNKQMENSSLIKIDVENESEKATREFLPKIVNLLFFLIWFCNILYFHIIIGV